MAYVGFMHDLPFINSTAKNTHVSVAENSLTDAVLLIAWLLVFANDVQINSIKIQSRKYPHLIPILIMILILKNTELRDTPNDEILNWLLKMLYLMKFQLRTFFNGNNSDNMQI